MFEPNISDFLVMNILWIYNMPLVPEAGGTERVTDIVAKGLMSKGYNCLGILEFKEDSDTMTYKGKNVTDLLAFLKEHKVHIVINQIGYASWLLKKFLNFKGKEWKANGGKIITCLHFDPQNPSYLWYLKSHIKKDFKLKIQILLAVMLNKRHLQKQVMQERNIYTFLYDNSDAFVVLSRTHIPYLLKVMCKPEASKLWAINNPLSFETISDVSVLKSKKKVVIVCARMSEYHKRVSLILETWRRLQKSDKGKDWHLKLLGDGIDLENYKSIVVKRKIPNVVFLGRRNPEQFYAEASILLLASSAEGWGQTLTEGMQYGVVPVVMDSSPVFHEIISNGKNGFICKDGDIDGYVKHILLLMSDFVKLGKMQIEAIKESQRYSIENTIEKWEKLFQNI